jgi:hypothetical protein
MKTRENPVKKEEQSSVAVQRKPGGQGASLAPPRYGLSFMDKKPPLVSAPIQRQVIQRVEIDDNLRKNSGLKLSEEDWNKLQGALENWEPLEGLDWFHGTTSTSLLLALRGDGRLVSAADLLKQNQVPLSGESGNALAPNYGGKAGASGTDLKNIKGGALHYTQGDEKFKMLYLAFQRYIEQAKTHVTEAFQFFSKDKNEAILRVRMASRDLGRLVWSAHMYAPQEHEVFQPMIKAVLDFNAFLIEKYEEANKAYPELKEEIENLVEVFNRARTDSFDVKGRPAQKRLMDENFPVVYSAAGGNSIEGIKGGSSVPGERLLRNPHLRRQDAQGAPPTNQIHVIFAPLKEVEGVRQQMNAKYHLLVLPIELLEVYHAKMHPPVVLSMPNFGRFGKKAAAASVNDKKDDL